MDIQARKLEFIQAFLKLDNERAIAQFEELLLQQKNRSIEPLSIQEFNARIDQSESDFDKGKFKESKEILAKYK